VEKKNEVIAEKNKDIIDSITYAKRLQDAILPPLSTIKKHLPDSFVLYKGDVILFTACDCTGHGVPGAMVSVVCSNALNSALKEFKIHDTGRLLDKVREIVLETFSHRDPVGEKSEGEVKDGMDCSFCAINTKTHEVEWSGANNPLWYIQNGEFKEIAPDKQPVGVFDNSKPFNKTKLKLSNGDSLYLFTDGYADQFGGPKGKKFKYKQLQQLITDNAHLTMEEQRQVLEKAFEDWKGQLEQTDDVCIIGIRI
jgi:serine phosphatase RsbU (regulator of sigma subunit)